MFASLRNVAQRTSTRTFTTSAPRRDLSKLTLIGRLGKQPEVRITKNEKEYCMYTVATTNFPPPPANPDGTRPESSTTWHRIMCFNPSAIPFLTSLKRGTKVYVEANYELREPEPDAAPDTPQGQRQIFLRHENMRVLARPPAEVEEASTSTAYR